MTTLTLFRTVLPHLFSYFILIHFKMTSTGTTDYFCETMRSLFPRCSKVINRIVAFKNNGTCDFVDQGRGQVQAQVLLEILNVISECSLRAAVARTILCSVS